MNERVESLVGIAFVVTSAASLGIAGVEVLNQDLLEQITEFGPFVLDYATLGSVIALVVAWIETDGSTNLSDADDIQTYLALGMLALIVYGAYDPAGLADQSSAIQLAALGVTVGGYWAIAHN